jgi:hypothetical protein
MTSNDRNNGILEITITKTTRHTTDIAKNIKNMIKIKYCHKNYN